MGLFDGLISAASSAANTVVSTVSSAANSVASTVTSAFGGKSSTDTPSNKPTTSTPTPVNKPTSTTKNAEVTYKSTKGSTTTLKTEDGRQVAFAGITASELADYYEKKAAKTGDMKWLNNVDLLRGYAAATNNGADVGNIRADGGTYADSPNYSKESYSFTYTPTTKNGIDYGIAPTISKTAVSSPTVGISTLGGYSLTEATTPAETPAQSTLTEDRTSDTGGVAGGVGGNGKPTNIAVDGVTGIDAKAGGLTAGNIPAEGLSVAALGDGATRFSVGDNFVNPLAVGGSAVESIIDWHNGLYENGDPASFAAAVAIDFLAPADLIKTVKKIADGDIDEVTPKDILCSVVDTIALIPMFTPIRAVKALATATTVAGTVGSMFIPDTDDGTDEYIDKVGNDNINEGAETPTDYALWEETETPTISQTVYNPDVIPTETVYPSTGWNAGDAPTSDEGLVDVLTSLLAGGMGSGQNSSTHQEEPSQTIIYQPTTSSGSSLPSFVLPLALLGAAGFVAYQILGKPRGA